MSDLSIQLVRPAKGRMVFGFGEKYEPPRWWGSHHNGQDYEGMGLDFYAAADGVVDKIGYEMGGYGNYIRLAHSGQVWTLYAHASWLYFKPGERVEQGKALGQIGNSGSAEAWGHLHFELRTPKNPVDGWPKGHRDPESYFAPSPPAPLPIPGEGGMDEGLALKVGGSWVVGSAPVRVRMGPGIGYDEIGWLVAGEELRAVELMIYHGWIKHKKGWSAVAFPGQGVLIETSEVYDAI